MSPRFYAPDAGAPGDLVTLPPDEAGHLTRVLRLTAGDAVGVFNGRGGEFEGVVERDGPRQVRVRVGAARPAAPEIGAAIRFAPAVLKGDAMDEVIRDAVMMGATCIQPIVPARSETGLASIERGRRRERWHRVAVASAKQCGRAVLPPVEAPCTFDALVADITQRSQRPAAVMFVEPDAAAASVPLAMLSRDVPAAITVLVGPEGGWTAEEMRLAAPLCELVTLRLPTIRADAMAAVALGALLAHWNVL